MADAWGNILEPPHEGALSEVKPGDIIAAMGAGILEKGVTIEAGQGLIAAGTVLGYKTATKKYVVYATGNTDGSGTARGILREAVDATSVDKLGNLIMGGTLKLSNLTGLDNDAITDLNGRSDSIRDWFIF